jgi:hypothetical protein
MQKRVEKSIQFSRRFRVECDVVSSGLTALSRGANTLSAVA